MRRLTINLMMGSGSHNPLQKNWDSATQLKRAPGSNLSRLDVYQGGVVVN